MKLHWTIVNINYVRLKRRQRKRSFHLKRSAKPNNRGNCYQTFLSLKHEESYLSSQLSDILGLKKDFTLERVMAYFVL